jgi:hypothetical protein
MMKIINKCKQAVENKLPQGTLPRAVFDLSVRCVMVIRDEGWATFWQKSKLRIRQRSLELKVKKESELLVFNNLKPLGNHEVRQFVTKSTDFPKCVALSTVKNEGDIISCWLSNMTYLFDKVYVADGNSTDGTREYLLDAARRNNNIRVFAFDPEGIYQKEIINRLAEIAISENSETWLFALDADEFLSVDSREHFVSLLRDQGKNQVLEMWLTNCLPAQFTEDIEFQPNSPYLISNKNSGIKKAAIHSSSFLKKRWRFVQGNHAVVGRFENVITGENVSGFLELMHVQYRSIDHFALKCIQGYLANDKLPPGRKDAQQGFHYLDNIKLINRMGNIDADILCRLNFNNNGLSIDQMLVDGKISSRSFISCHNLPINIHRKSKHFDLANEMVKTHPRPDLIKFLEIVKTQRTQSKVNS